MTDTTRACLWMLGAIVSFTTMAIAGRQVSFALDTFEIMLFRSILGIAIVAGVAAWAGTLHQVNRDRLGLHLLRNMCHFAGQNLWFFAIVSIPLAQVFALEFTTPIWAMLLAPLILRERITLTGLAAALIAFAGILVVTRPGSLPITPGVLAAAGAAVGFALAALFTRKLTRTASITCILFYLTTMQAVMGLICAGYDGDIAMPTMTTLPWLVLIGCAGLFAHFCMTSALALAPAAVVMPVDFFRLPVIAFIGFAFYGETLDPLLFLGAILIFGGNYLNLSLGKPAPARPDRGFRDT